MYHTGDVVLEDMPAIRMHARQCEGYREGIRADVYRCEDQGENKRSGEQRTWSTDTY